MITPSLGRFVRATWQQNSSAIEVCPIAASRAAAANNRPIRGHQRRHSSSKTPVAGEGVKVVGRAQRAQNEQGHSEEQYPPPLRPMGRRRRRSEAQPKTLDTMSNLPSVPPTHHLDARDIGIASFFSQHRPISITSTLPTPTTNRAFESIFDPSKHPHTSPDSIESTRQKMRQILFSLRAHESSNKGLLSTDSPDTLHLDGLPPTPQNLDQVLQNASFRPPPPPEPGMPGFGAQRSSNAEAAEQTAEAETDALFSPRPRRRSFKQKMQRKSWSTTIIVTETTDMLGGKSYATTNSPIIQIPIRPSSTPSPMTDAPRGEGAGRVQDPYVEHPPLGQSAVVWRQPFLQRMWLRQQEHKDRMDEEGGMLLISVKRQRKLKMKKHKYKKLMRRTRNLRRKLGKD